MEFFQRNSHRRLGRMVGLCIALFALLPHLSHAFEWHSVDNTSDGIQIFRKEVKGSGLIAFRGYRRRQRTIALSGDSHL